MNDMQEESVCHCEVIDVTHTDTFSSQSVFSRLRNRCCKDVKSYSVTIQKWTRSEQYFLRFKKEAKDVKPHQHEVPHVGTGLISVNRHSDSRIGFEIYRIPHPLSDTLQPLLFLSVTNEDAQQVEKHLRRSLQVSSYAITDFFDATTQNTTEHCFLHLTPHYICVTSKTEQKYNLKILTSISITDAIVAYKNNKDSPNELRIVISSNEVTAELRFSSELKVSIIKKLKALKHTLCECDDEKEPGDNKEESGNKVAEEGGSKLIRECSEDTDSDAACTKTVSPTYPEKVVLPLEFTPDSKPPLVNRSVKPTSRVGSSCSGGVLATGGANGGMCEGVTIRYVNNTYQNVLMKPSGEALKLSVAVFASEPLLNDPWLVEIIFIRSEDYETTFKSVEESQKACGRHLIAPCRPIRAVTGMVVVLDVSQCPEFKLNSKEQHISYDKLVEISNVSWLVVEKVLHYEGPSKREVTLLAKLRLVSDPDGVNEEITIMQKFKAFSMANPSDSGCSTFASPTIKFPLPYHLRVQFCQLLDNENPTGKDWKYFASVMQIDTQTIEILENKARERNFSYSEYLLRHLESTSPEKCHYHYVESVLRHMGRRDLLDILVEASDGAVESVSQDLGRRNLLDGLDAANDGGVEN